MRNEYNQQIFAGIPAFHSLSFFQFFASSPLPKPLFTLTDQRVAPKHARMYASDVKQVQEDQVPDYAFEMSVSNVRFDFLTLSPLPFVSSDLSTSPLFSTPLPRPLLSSPLPSPPPLHSFHLLPHPFFFTPLLIAKDSAKAALPK